MALTGSGDVDEALALVGELLAAEGHEYAVTILGGAALNLLGIVERTTTDVDILAFATPRANAAPDPDTLRAPPEPIPEPLARYDLTFFKLFASVDSSGPRSVHYQDLLALRPSRVELDRAADWVRTQDASPAFAGVLDQVIHHVREDLGLE